MVHSHESAHSVAVHHHIAVAAQMKYVHVRALYRY